MKQVALRASISLAVISAAIQPALAETPYDGADVGRPSDILAVRNVEVTFHTAGSMLPQKNLELMMSLYAPNATLTDTVNGNKVYVGKDQVRAYWANVSGPFRPEHNWIGYTPAMRIRARVHGEHATLYFECLWMDLDKNAIGTHSFSAMTLTKRQGRWLVETIKVGKIAAL